MSKTLVTVIGLVVSLGVIALGFFLVALPIFVQSLGVDAQTATVANTNAIYQAQVDALEAEQENLPAIEASVDSLRAQIPATAKLDDVFEVVGLAAQNSGVQVVSITAGEQVAFVPRTSASDDPDAAPAAVQPEATTDPAAGTTDPATGAVDPATGAAAPSTPDAGGAAAGTGRQQVDFAIQVTAADMGQVTAFLDALRAGPRLLSSIQATAAQTGEGTITVQVTALTYVDTEGAVQ